MLTATIVLVVLIALATPLWFPYLCVFLCVLGVALDDKFKSKKTRKPAP